MVCGDVVMQIKLLISFSLIVIGMAVLVWASIKFVNQQKLVKNSVFTTGMVVGYEYFTSSNHANLSNSPIATSRGRVTQSSRLPIIEFITQSGENIRFTSQTTAQVGTGGEVEVMYDPIHPNDAKLGGYFNLLGWIIMVGGHGALLMLVGVALRFLL